MRVRVSPAQFAGIVLVPGSTLAAQSSAVKPLVDGAHRRMQPKAALDFSRGSTIVVAGDPAKPGMYVTRRLAQSRPTGTR